MRLSSVLRAVLRVGLRGERQGTHRPSTEEGGKGECLEPSILRQGRYGVGGQVPSTSDVELDTPRHRMDGMAP